MTPQFHSTALDFTPLTSSQLMGILLVQEPSVENHHPEETSRGRTCHQGQGNQCFSGKAKERQCLHLGDKAKSSKYCQHQ